MKLPKVLYIIMFVLLVAALACSFGGGDDADDSQNEPEREEVDTDTPEPVEEPTDTPEPAVEEPTEAPVVEEPVEEPEVTGDFYVSNITLYEDDYGDLIVCGLLLNNLDMAVDYIDLDVTVYDAAGNSIYQDTTYTDLVMLASGAESPFSLDTYEELPDASYAEVVVSDYWDNTYDEAVEVVIDNSHVVVDDFMGTYIIGEVYNPNDFPVYLSGLTVAVFWDDGTMKSDAINGALLNYLPAGVYAPFRIELWDVGEEIYDADAYQMFYYDARKTDPVDYNITLNGDPWLYVDYYDGFHMAGEIGNEDEVQLQPYLVGALYDENGMIIDAAEIGIPYPVVPGYLAPFDFTYWGPMDLDPAYFDEIGTYEIFVDYYSTWTSSYEVVDLENFTFTSELQDDGIYVSGTVINDLGVEISSPVVVSYVIDLETDLVFATNYTWIWDDLADGAEVPFELTIYTHSGIDPDNIEIYTFITAEIYE